MKYPLASALLLSGTLCAALTIGVTNPRAAAAAPSAATYPNSFDDFQAMKAKAHGGTVYTPLTVPDWSGLWRRLGDPEKLDPTPIVPYLTPKYKAAYDEKRAKDAKGILWDRLSWCLPMGMPRWLADPWLHEYIIQPKETWLLYEQLEEERRVYTDGRGHVPDDVAFPQWEGDSIGFWDGDTLVIHTNHIKAGEYWRGSPDTSFQATTIERMRKVDADTIESQLTVYDPVSLTRPVHLTYTYKKIKDQEARINYDSCEEGNNNYRTDEGGTGTRLPGEPGYREPTNFGIADVAIDSRPQ